jgi:Cap4 SAVED domain
MANLKSWCKSIDTLVGGHRMHHLHVATEEDMQAGIRDLAKAVPSHYASPERIAGILDRLGKPLAASYLRQKLPTTKTNRSGDLGEIIASSYVDEYTTFTVAVNKLRWKDHREVAMRGDDIIGLEPDFVARKLRFLKGEVKSAASVTSKRLQDARNALEKSDGLPSPHALSFIADRLCEEGKVDLAALVDQVNLSVGIRPGEMDHMIFIFSGNDPTGLLTKALQSYGGAISQRGVGLSVKSHQQFIKAVFEKVGADG